MAFNSRIPDFRMVTRTHVKSITSNVIIAAAAYIAGYHFTELFQSHTSQIGGLWAVISGIIVYEDSRSKALTSAKLRVIGSFIGALISGVYLYFFPFTVVGYVVCIGVGALICHLLRLPDHIKLTGVTISVIMIVSLISYNADPVMNAALRFVESVIGTAVAVIVAYAVSAGWGEEL